jgi:hypothetical protein
LHGDHRPVRDADFPVEAGDFFVHVALLLRNCIRGSFSHRPRHDDRNELVSGHYHHAVSTFDDSLIGFVGSIFEEETSTRHLTVQLTGRRPFSCWSEGLANLRKLGFNFPMEAKPYFSMPVQRLSRTERYFAALLLAFKLFASAMIILAVIWEITLLPQWSDAGLFYVSTHGDFCFAAASMNNLCLIAAVIILIGGLFQMAKHSRRVGLWSVSFACLVLTFVLFYTSHISSMSSHHDVLNLSRL